MKTPQKVVRKKKQVLVGQHHLMRPSRKKMGTTTILPCKKSKKRFTERKIKETFNVQKLYRTVEMYKAAVLKGIPCDENQTIYDKLAFKIIRNAIERIQTNAYDVLDT